MQILRPLTRQHELDHTDQDLSDLEDLDRHRGTITASRFIAVRRGQSRRFRTMFMTCSPFVA